MLPQAIARSAAQHGDVVAYRTHQGWGLTYAELDRLSDEAAVWLELRDVGEGSVVALSLPSRVDYIVSALAAAKVGAVISGLDPGFSEAQRDMALDVLQPDLVLAASARLPDSLEVEKVHLAEAPEEILASERVIGETPEPLAADPDRPVMICFVEGGDGRPKGAWFANRQLAAIAALGGASEPTPGIHRYQSGEFAHAATMTRLPAILGSAATTYLLHDWNADSLLQLFHNYRISSVTTTSAELTKLLQVGEVADLDLSSVESLVSDAPLDASVAATAAAGLFDAQWAIHHSSTESGGVGLTRIMDSVEGELLNCIGRPLSGVDAAIQDSEGKAVPSGGIGELSLRSDAIMNGYWNDPAATSEVLVDGWLRTGVRAVVDSTGCVRLAGER